MAKKITQDEIAATLKNFITAANNKYGTHDFAAGYMSTLLEVLVKDLPAHHQKLIIQALNVQTTNLTEVTI
jgi:hypothetical protein